ncbi:hypothetical protein ACFONG_00925 [Uliginosibacterium paludis]|uniref:Uncharacterized protein n=1 Tax=Uliginosibacterium paludis TaxID=1615952 RepID=A0ABV2CQW8_9RHOO
MKLSRLAAFLILAAGLAAQGHAATQKPAGQGCDRPPPPPAGAQSAPAGERPPGPPPGEGKERAPGCGPAAGADGMPPPPPDAAAGKAEIRAEHVLAGGNAVWAQREFATRAADTSAVLATRGAKLALNQISVRKDGNTSSFDASSFLGMNAALLANEGAALSVKDGHVLATGSGANGAFAHGSGASVRLEHVEIRATGDNAHGVMVAGGGTMTLNEVSIFTSAQRSAAIATDRGGGTVRVKGGSWRTTGRTSPVLYSTGMLDVNGGEGSAGDSEAIVIEGSNSVSLTGTELSGARNGAMIYQSFSGDAQGQHGRLAMLGGALRAASGPLFFVTNASADVEVRGSTLEAVSGVLAEARADRWGRKGANGGHLALRVAEQTVQGRLLTDTLSDIRLSLEQGANWTGSAKGKVSVQLGEKAVWTLDGNTEVQALKGADCESGTCRNIRGKGHVLRYDVVANAWAAGRSFALEGGGELKPALP